MKNLTLAEAKIKLRKERYVIVPKIEEDDLVEIIKDRDVYIIKSANS